MPWFPAGIFCTNNAKQNRYCTTLLQLFFTSIYRSSDPDGTNVTWWWRPFREFERGYWVAIMRKEIPFWKIPALYRVWSTTSAIGELSKMSIWSSCKTERNSTAPPCIHTKTWTKTVSKSLKRKEHFADLGQFVGTLTRVPSSHRWCSKNKPRLLPLHSCR